MVNAKKFVEGVFGDLDQAYQEFVGLGGSYHEIELSSRSFSGYADGYDHWAKVSAFPRSGSPIQSAEANGSSLAEAVRNATEKWKKA